jgi:hypothetical protein
MPYFAMQQYTGIVSVPTHRTNGANHGVRVGDARCVHRTLAVMFWTEEIVTCVPVFLRGMSPDLGTSVRTYVRDDNGRSQGCYRPSLERPKLGTKVRHAATSREFALPYSMVRSLVSGRKIMPTTAVANAITTGYQSPAKMLP